MDPMDAHKQSLVKLSRDKETEQAIYLLETGWNPDEQNAQGQSALHWASMTNNITLVNALLNAKANPDIEDQSCYTPLHMAVLRHNTEVARSLLEFGANPDIKRLTGQTSLHIAAKNNHMDLVTLLFNFKANPTIVSDRKETPLHVCIENSSPEIVKILLFSGVDPCVLNEDGDTAINTLAQAIAANRNPNNLESRLEIMQQLVQDGRSLHLANLKGQTAVDVIAEEYVKSHSREMTFVLKCLLESKVKLTAEAKEDIFVGLIQRARYQPNVLPVMLPYIDPRDIVVKSVSTAMINLARGRLNFMKVYTGRRMVTPKRMSTMRECKAEQFLRISRMLCEVGCKPPTVDDVDDTPNIGQYVDNAEDCSKMEEDFITEGLKVWKNYAATGPSLQTLARNCIREHMRNWKKETFEKLPIPLRLREYVSMAELRNLEY